MLAIELDEGRIAATEGNADLVVAIDVALEKLGGVDPRLVRLVEWRFFAGMTFEEIAEGMEMSERTMKRDWRRARAFLYRELAAEGIAP